MAQRGKIGHHGIGGPRVEHLAVRHENDVIKHLEYGGTGLLSLLWLWLVVVEKRGLDASIDQFD